MYVLNTQVVRVLSSGVPVEKHAYKVYTHQLFKFFSDQLFNSGPYIVKQAEDNHEIVVEHRASWCEIKYGMHVDIENGVYDCECGLFLSHWDAMMSRSKGNGSFWCRQNPS